MSFTVQNLIDEVQQRPGFRFIPMGAGNPALATFIQAAKSAQEDYYESHALSLAQYADSVAPAGIAIPAGTTWGPNGSIYELTPVTVAPLPANFVMPIELWVINPTTNVITHSSSTYDNTTGTRGSGIPDADDTSITAIAVFHELINVGANVKLRIYAGSTTTGATPKLGMRYLRTPVAIVDATSTVDVPDFDRFATFNGVIDQYLRKYIGISE